MIKKNLDIKLAVVGLGYVGLPLALEFGKKRMVTAYDINYERIKKLKLSIDINLETTKKQFKESNLIKFTNRVDDLKSANFYIVAVPTPVDRFKKPDLNLLLKSSAMIGKVLKKNDIVVYESTVYPGCIEDDCVPVLEKYSKLKFNKDFFCGYSPERINPGDKKHTISKIKKITSGSTPKVAQIIDQLYKEIIIAGTHKAPSIKVAEAAKVIENVQRDLNIALINELSMIFNKMKINTDDVLEAANTKWNFLPFKPGLVGGHCIGVDPYYLTYKSKVLGYKPKVILAGRKINDSMSRYVVSKFLEKIKLKNFKAKDLKVLIMGLAFKEDCNDLRNSGVANIINHLRKHKCDVDLYDPNCDIDQIKKTYKIYPKLKIYKNTYDAIIIVVAHRQFKEIGFRKIKKFCKKKHLIFDIKNMFNSNEVDFKL